MLLMAQATYSLKFVNLSDRIAARADSSGVFDEFLKKCKVGIQWSRCLQIAVSIGETIYFIDCHDIVSKQRLFEKI